MLPFLDAVERLILVRDGYYATDHAQSRRAAVILSLDAGKSVASVARLAGCSRTTVYTWLRLYEQHRNPQALRGSELERIGQRGFEISAALNAMPGNLKSARGLGLDVKARNALRLDAMVAPDAKRRRRSAMLWALDRGVPLPHVAHVAGVSRQAVHQLQNRAIVERTAMFREA